MAIHPRYQPQSPERRQWEAIADLRREIRQIREGRADGLQRATVESLPAQAGINTTPFTLVSATVNIPTEQNRVIMFGSATFTQSNALSEWGLYYRDDVDITSPRAIEIITNSSGGFSLFPKTPSVTSGPSTTGSAALFINPYHPATLDAPTPGEHVWSLQALRTAGAATLTVSDVRLWVAVV